MTTKTVNGQPVNVYTVDEIHDFVYQDDGRGKLLICEVDGMKTYPKEKACKWCADGPPEFSEYSKVWIHRRESLDRRCDNPPADWAVEDKDGGMREFLTEAEAREWVAEFPEIYTLLTRQSAGEWRNAS